MRDRDRSGKETRYEEIDSKLYKWLKKKDCDGLCVKECRMRIRFQAHAVG